MMAKFRFQGEEGEGEKDSIQRILLLLNARYFDSRINASAR